MERQRTLYFDWLRVLATLAVVMIHVSGAWFASKGINATQWYISVAFDRLTRWAVPMFVMISGALFLNKEISVKTLYSKYILRIATALVGWSLLYAIITDPTANVKGMFVNVLYGHYHMWFCYMIIGLYITLPILRKIVECESVMKYFLGVVLVVAFLIPQLISIMGILPESSRLMGEIFDTVLRKLRLGMFGSFAGYFVAGYNLSKKDISVKQRRGIYILGAVALVVTVAGTVLVSKLQGNPSEMFFESATVHIAVLSVSIFVFGKYEISKLKVSEKISRFVAGMSKYSFGSYLVHALVLTITWQVIPVEATEISALWGIPVISVAVFVISMGISAILNQIAIVKRYIV